VERVQGSRSSIIEHSGELRRIEVRLLTAAPISSAGSSVAECVQGNADEVGGSSPPPRSISKIKPFQFRWREPLGKPECPYARRTLLNLKWFSVRVHEWIRSDDARYFHDHPWSFLTLVLRGSYVDVSSAGRDKLRTGSIRFRRAEHRHYVEVPPGRSTYPFIDLSSNSQLGFLGKRKVQATTSLFRKIWAPTVLRAVNKQQKGTQLC
jgi:hypothetical protein